VLPRISQRRVCQVLAVARSAVRRPVRVDRRRAGSVNEHLVTRLTGLIERHPTFGYRRLGAILRFRDGQRITPKTVYRICALKRWFVHQRPVAPQPPVQGRISHAGRSNERWATDLPHVYCGRDGWAHLVAVIDCHDRELIGHEFALRGRPRRPNARSRRRADNASGRCDPPGPPRRPLGQRLALPEPAVSGDYRLTQEFITPYTPEQNGIIERFFRSLKEERVWQHNFTSLDHARRELTAWMRW